jgi:polysaccharide pyruvyl transferase WcaK-like protein
VRIFVVSGDRGEPGGWPRNIGDELLTERLAAFLRTEGHDVGVADFGSASPRRNRFVVTTRGQLWRAIRAADLVLIGGGTMVQDDQPARFFAGLPRLCSTVVVLCSVARTPVGFVSVGVQPLTRRISRIAFGWSMRRAQFVLARDPASLEVARSMKGAKASLACDAALFGSPFPQREGAGHGVVIALNRAEASLLSQELLGALVRKHDSVQLISMDQSADSDFGMLARPLPAGVEVVQPQLTNDEVVEHFSRSRVIIASRMHALYIAALLGKPSIAVESSAKVAAFAAEFDVPLVATAKLADPCTEPRAVQSIVLDRIAARGTAALDAALAKVQR